MVNLFGDNSFSSRGDFNILKKVVQTEGKLKDFIEEIQESYRQGFTPYREHKKDTGLWITPLRVYDNKIFEFSS